MLLCDLEIGQDQKICHSAHVFPTHHPKVAFFTPVDGPGVFAEPEVDWGPGGVVGAVTDDQGAVTESTEI